MVDCSMCDGSIRDKPSNYRVVLEIEDMTRSTKQFMGDETSIKRHYLDQYLCHGCWQELYDQLSGD